MSDRDRSAAEEQIVDELDNVLPGEIDRRKFLHGSLGSLGAMMLAGCTGGGGGRDTTTSDQATTAGGDTTTAGEEAFTDNTKAVFTTPWKKEPSWGHAHVAEGRGYWKDAGVPNINATRGNGSDTEAQNIGVGNKPMGISSLTTALSVYPETQNTEALNMTMMGLARGRPLLSLIWRKDQMKDRTDIAGKSILAASGFAAATAEVYPNLVGVDPSEVDIQEGTEEVAAPKLANNEVQAIWGSIDLYPTYQEQVDAELGVTPLTAFGAFPGYPIWVNNSWFENKENNVEFMSHVLTGYFKALKWGLLNQSEYLDYLKSEVNPNLRTWTQEELVGQHSVNCAQAVTLDMKDNGLGYFTQDGLSFVLDNAASALVDNPDALPSASELVDTRAFEQSEKVTFSDSEWNRLSQNAGEIWGIFEEAESGN
ncbi:ABC transporter substrate-binding protein [Halorussus sp. AFM4]|uniref:ABC transporter substrate-binding protein n=1 Tax=Halorussus sp. AFM4 TaxID=3421651 RepID=UPI003EB7192A